MEQLTRLPDWEPRLNEFLASRQPFSFGWGRKKDSEDCASFGAGVVQAVTGVDLYKPFKGTYADEASAMEALANSGHPNILSLLESLFPRVKCSMAQRGDIVLTKAGNVGVCWGSVALCIGHDDPVLIAAGLQAEGLQRVERADWRRAWKIG